SPAQQLRLILQSQPSTKPADRGRLETLSSTIGADLSPQAGPCRTPLRRVEILKVALDDRQNLGRKRLHRLRRPAPPRQQGAGAARIAISLQPSKQRRPADFEGRARRPDLCIRWSLGQLAQDRGPALGCSPYLPVGALMIHRQVRRLTATWSQQPRINWPVGLNNPESVS